MKEAELAHYPSSPIFPVRPDIVEKVDTAVRASNRGFIIDENRYVKQNPNLIEIVDQEHAAVTQLNNSLREVHFYTGSYFIHRAIRLQTEEMQREIPKITELVKRTYFLIADLDGRSNQTLQGVVNLCANELRNDPALSTILVAPPSAEPSLEEQIIEPDLLAFYRGVMCMYRVMRLGVTAQTIDFAAARN